MAFYFGLWALDFDYRPAGSRYFKRHDRGQMQAGWIRWASNRNVAGNIGQQVKIIVGQNFPTFIIEVHSVTVDPAADFNRVSSDIGSDPGFRHSQLAVRRQQPNGLVLGDVVTSQGSCVQPFRRVAFGWRRQRDAGDFEHAIGRDRNRFLMPLTLSAVQTNPAVADGCTRSGQGIVDDAGGDAVSRATDQDFDRRTGPPQPIITGFAPGVVVNDGPADFTPTIVIGPYQGTFAIRLRIILAEAQRFHSTPLEHGLEHLPI